MTKLENRNSKIVTSPHIELAVRDFQDLLVWKLARQLRVQIYGFLKALPADERYALSSQLRRAVQSIGANIAEGSGRYSYQENIQFSRQACGSAYERDHLVTASDAGFISDEQFQEADALA
jgi:four helix bundle protein